MATFIAATVLAGAAAAAAIALAPAAAADRNDRTDRGGSGGASASSSSSIDRGPNKATPAQRGGVNNRTPDYSGLPKGWTNEAMWARPGQNPFGSGPIPPALALD